MGRVAVVLLGGGSGTRVGAAVNKILLPLGGGEVWEWSLRTLTDLRSSTDLQVDPYVVARPEDYDRMAGLHGVPRIDPGPQRHDSEWNALQFLAADIESGRYDVVVLHDLARPLAGVRLWRDVIAAAFEHGGGVPVQARAAVVQRADGRSAAGLVAVQTPQAFRAAPLLAAYRRADREGFQGTDTAACVARFTDVRIVGVPSSAGNLKITYSEDLMVAERLLLRSEEA